MEPIKHRVTHYWSHRAESFEKQRLREFDSAKRERWLEEFRRYCAEMNIKYVIACNEYYGPEETDGYYNPEFFAENLTEAARFDDGTIIYSVL